MKKYKNDIILAGAVLFAALILLIIYLVVAGGKAGLVEAVVDGKSYGIYSLNEDKEVEILTSYGRNLLIIENGCAYVAEADCPDGICVRQGKINRRGQSIICLPHKLTIRLIEGEEDDVDAAAGK